MKRWVFALLLLLSTLLQAQVCLKSGHLTLNIDKGGFFSSVKVYGKEVLHERRRYPVVTAYVGGTEVFPSKMELREGILSCEMDDKAWVRIAIDSSVWEVVECPSHYTALAIGPIGYKAYAISFDIIPLNNKVIAGAPPEALAAVKQRYQIEADDATVFHSSTLQGDGFLLDQYYVGNWNGPNGKPESRPVRNCHAAWVDIVPGAEGTVVGAKWKWDVGGIIIDPTTTVAPSIRVSCSHLSDTSEYVSPIPSEHLLRQLQFMTVDPIGVDDTVLRVITGLHSCFANEMPRNIVRIDNELITYSDMDEDEGLVTLYGCSRGALGTQALSHKKYAVGCRLWTASDGSLMADRYLLDQLADRLIARVNKMKIGKVCLDDLDDLEYIGHSDFEAGRLVARLRQGFDPSVCIELNTANPNLLRSCSLYNPSLGD